MAGRIEELTDDVETTLDLRTKPIEPSPTASKPKQHQTLPFPPKAGSDAVARPSDGFAPAMPPAMASVKQYNADEVVSMLNRIPLFMTTLDETDGQGGENVELEAIRALAYEGTRAEVAANFREQGNEQAKLKRWADAKEFYSKAIAAVKGPRMPLPEPGEGPADMEVVEVDEEMESKKELQIEEACYANRALCNLELKNYRACNLDCAATLRLNPSNVKAWYRSATACLALDKISEAQDACDRGLEVDIRNGALAALKKTIQTRKTKIEEVERQRREREARLAAEQHALKTALKARNYRVKSTDEPPEMEDAVVKLADPLKPESVLSIPVLLLYPLHMQTDLIKQFDETHSLLDHLSYILPLPWDEAAEYTTHSVDCYIETHIGGLIKAGKKLALNKILGSGKVEIVDGLVRVYVVPQVKAQTWIEDFKTKRRR